MNVANAAKSNSGFSEFLITLEKSKWGLYNRVPENLPTSFENKRITPTARAIEEKVFNFTRKKKSEKTGEEKQFGCRFTYEQMISETGRGRSTVAAALEELRSKGIIQKTNRDIDGTEYIYVGDPTSGAYYVIPQYLYSVELCVKGEYRRITGVQTHVLAYLMTQCAAPMNGGKPNCGGGICKTSFKKLARVLNFSVAAVRAAIHTLMKARVVFRTERNKGKNGKKLSGYEVHAGLYLYRKYIKKAKTVAEEEGKRDSYYTDLREQAQRRAEKYFAIASKNKDFLSVHKKISGLKIREAKAELYEPDTLPALEAEKRALMKERKTLLSRMGLKVSDISLQCSCSVCKDKGRLPSGGWCTCYPGGAL